MKIELTEQQYRYLLDLVYIGNWVLNSTRENDRIQEYDQVESLIFSHCLQHKMSKLVELYQGELIPSRAFADGGIHEAIESYEDIIFYEILGKAFLYGEGNVQKDEEKGLKYLEKAASKGRQKAMMMAAVCHYNGVGTEKNEARARDYFGRAAKQGNPQAIQVIVAMDNGEKLRF